MTGSKNDPTILIATVLVKVLFFPLANKSYASIAKTKAGQNPP